MSGNSKNKKDMGIVVLATGCFYFLSIFIDLGEVLRDSFAVDDFWQLDELFLTLIFLSLCLLWYSHRRYSDFKIAKVEFHESELRYQTLYKHAPIGIAMAYQDGTLICCNQAMCDMTGYSEEELKRINIDDTYVNPEDRKQHLQSFKKGYTLRQGSIPRKRKDGSIYFVDPIVTSFQFEGQNVLLAMVEDITERKAAEEQIKSNYNQLNDKVNARTSELAKANESLLKKIAERKESEDALRKSEHRYEKLFTSLLEGVCMLDASEKIIFCNPAFSKLLEEESPEHMIGKSIFDYLSPYQREIIHSQRATRDSNLCSKYEIEIITAKKHRRILQVSASSIFNESGEYCGASANLFDTTEVNRLRELESRAQRLETAGRIAGQVAHDFNNLLAPLMAYPDLIREELSNDHPAQEYLKAMEISAAQIAAINEQLLTLGRRGHYNLVPMDLNQVVRKAVEDSKQVHSSIEYQINLAEDISKIMGGPAQIHRVVSNLLENACESMKDIGVITISTENNCIREIGSSTGELIPAGEYVKLTVSDAGEGIEEAVLPKIFDPFFSSKETDRRRGSGLGLSVVHSVVQDHSGYLDLSTRVGEGTSFYLYFPTTDKCAEKAHNEEYDGGSESILIVDDDPLQRDVSGKLLAKLGYRTTLAKSGEQAIELLSRGSYDLLILDMIMPPGIDGTETYRRALAVNPEQKVIIVSGFSESVRVTEAKSLGAGAFVKKPLTRQLIARAVRTELERELDDVTA